MIKSIYVLLTCLVFCLPLKAKDRILDQTISINLENTAVRIILKTIEEVGNVKFSYNPDLIDDQKKVNLSLNQKTIRFGLNTIFENSVRLKEVGSHILILEKEYDSGINTSSPKKTVYLIKGSVIDKETNQPIPYVSVYDIESRFSLLTDNNGQFEIEVPSTYKTISLYYAKTNYRTNVKLISIKGDKTLNGTIGLYKKTEVIDKIPSASVPNEVWVELEDKTISGELFSIDVSTHSENLRYLNENRWAQISLIPQLSLKAGKNYRGILYNHFSINILGGYSKGLKGLEIGGIANVLKEESYGIQLGGITNLVGGKFAGIQAGGISNTVKKNFLGVQLGGINNTVRQNYFGIQVAGITNHVNGRFNGLQISGITNSVFEHMNGFQISGITSRCKSGFNGFQLSGLINHTTKDSYGIQISGIQNVALNKFVGAQITGFMNSAIEGTNFLQLSGLFNIANINNGLQLSGLINTANQNNGLQIALVNISKINKGISIGLVNFVWNGYHKIEIMSNEIAFANIRIKSGVKRFYNIYSAGRQFNGNNSLTLLGYGYGAIYNFSEKFAISTDIEGIIAFNSQKQFTQLIKFSPSFDFKISDHFALFAGPTFNLNYSVAGINEIQLDEYSIFNDLDGDNYYNTWIGGQFGLRF